MKNSHIRLIILIALLLVILIPLTSLGGDKVTVTLYTDRPEAKVNDTVHTTQGVPFLYDNKTYVPMDDILTLCGFTLGWDSNSNSTVAAREKDLHHIVFGTDNGVLWVNDKKHTFDTPPLIYKGVAYLSLEMFAAMSDDAIYIIGTPETSKMNKRDTLKDTVINDNVRLSGNAATYNSITIIGNTGMELLSVTDKAATEYASMVNAVADALPDVNVYNIAVPTACEFYAPKSLYTNQTAGIRKIYESLNPNVTPVNVVKPLMKHAAESIYFKTDHHWTQRGAYYAYREFIELKGEEIDPLESFEVINSFSHVGSFASFTAGTEGENIMRSNPDLLQKYMPKYTAAGASYNDMYLQDKNWDLELVFPTFNTYSAFIGGDSPLAVFRTSNANGKSLVIIKESFGTAFATWAANNYEFIFVIDPRKYNGFGGHNAKFDLREFYGINKFDDLVIINYPGTIASSSYRNSVLKMIGR